MTLHKTRRYHIKITAGGGGVLGAQGERRTEEVEVMKGWLNEGAGIVLVVVCVLMVQSVFSVIVAVVVNVVVRRLVEERPE